MNPHIDAVQLVHAGRTATLRFSWRVLRVMQRDWGADEWSQRFVEALNKEKADDMAEAIALMSGLSVDEVLDWSPPTALAAQAMWDAYGILKMGQKSDATGDDASPNPLKARSILSTASAALRFVQGLAGPNSGNKPPTQPASN